MPHPLNEPIFNLPMPEYRAAEGISQTALKQVEISPRHYLSYINEAKREPTPAQVIGTLTHDAVLEQVEGYVVKPDDFDGRTAEGKRLTKHWEDCKITAISKEIHLNIKGMTIAVQNHPMARKILYGQGHNEVSIFKRHEPTGLLLKGRADRLTVDGQNLTVVADLKTCERGGAKEGEFSKSIWNWGYHRQAKFYLKLFGASYFVFVVVEKEAPYAVNCFNLDARSLSIGDSENERDLAIIKSCTDSGDWPAYGEDLRQINIPDWAIRKSEQL